MHISVNGLEDAIYDYLGQHNTKPKPFTWTKTDEGILTPERRALDKLDEIRAIANTCRTLNTKLRRIQKARCFQILGRNELRGY